MRHADYRAGLLSLVNMSADPALAARFGVQLGAAQVATLAALLGAGLLSALIPAIRVYRTTLADGSSVRV